MNIIINLFGITLMTTTVVVILAPLWFAYRSRCLGFVALSAAVAVQLILEPLAVKQVLAHLAPPTRITLGEQYALVYYGCCTPSLVLFGFGVFSIYRHVAGRSHVG